MPHFACVVTQPLECRCDHQVYVDMELVSKDLAQGFKLENIQKNKKQSDINCQKITYLYKP